MIDPAAVGEILAQYEKHGWKLRRALLSPDAKNKLSDFNDAVDSDLNALWFSRQSKPDAEAWELRRLSALPFALVTVIPIDATDEEREDALNEIEDDMRERTLA